MKVLGRRDGLSRVRRVAACDGIPDGSRGSCVKAGTAVAPRSVAVSRPVENATLAVRWLAAFVTLASFVTLPVASVVPRAAAAATLTPVGSGLVVYADAVTLPWQDWSWGGVSNNFSAASPIHSGTRAIAVTYTGSWSGLQLGRLDLLDVSAYDTFRFFVHGGSSGGQTIQVVLGNNSSGASITQNVTPAAGAWTQVDVPLWGLGQPAQVTYVSWFNNTGGAQSTYYLDDISFVASGAPTPTPVPPGTGPALSIDVSAGRHPISPFIYGMNFADENLAAELALPVRRWGGNSTTRYNWQTDTSNHASDWYFENIPNDNGNPAALPDGSSSDRFVDQDRRTGTATLMTVPLIGWTPKDRAYACGFSVAKYGAQHSTDPWRPDCGNGITASGSTITGNSPVDTSVAITPSYVQAWVQHFIGRYGTAAGGGVRFYNLDNEPMLWSDTHRDVHPSPTSFDEIRDRTFAYAAAIKAVDPSAQTLGPAEWGWTGYFWSTLDWVSGGDWWNNPQDRLAHGNTAFAEWYLQQMRTYEEQHGTRILDYLDEHYYPQASGVSLSGAGDANTQALRLRSTRSLWDPTYVDESWIADTVRLIPRMREWMSNNYPSTKLAISEYNWGALDHINGALAQADVLGIFGREGLDLATLWRPPTSTQPGAFAFRMFLNYDGARGRFGDIGVRADSDDQSQLSVYAAQRSSDGALTIIVVNKTGSPLTSTVTLAGFNGAVIAPVFRYSPANVAAVVRDTDQPIGPAGFSSTFPASSITLLVLPTGAGSASATPSASSTATSTATITRTMSATASPTRIAIATPTMTPSATATATPSRTPSATPTKTPTTTRTSAATVAPTSTPTPSLTKAASATASASFTATPAATFTSAAATPTEAGPLGYWRFDEGRGTVVGDSSGFGNTGTAQNGMTWSTGRIGGAGAFDAVDDQVRISSSPSVNVSGTGLSIEAWVRPSATDGYRVLVHKEGQFSLALSNGQLTYADSMTWSYATVGSYGNVATNAWSHVAVTFDGSSIRFYLNGIVVGTKARIGSLTANGNPLCLGAYNCSALRFGGALDEVALYARPLSAAELQAHAAAGNPTQTPTPAATPAGRTAFWRFDEGSGTTVRDSSGMNNSGTAQNGMAWTSGKVGSAGAFDGVDDQVRIADSASVRITGTGLTIAAWVRPTASNGYRVIVHKEGQYSFALSNGQLTYADSIAWSYATIGAYGSVPLNTWSYVAVTFDGIVLRFYVSGAEVGNTPHTGSVSANTNPVCLASYNCAALRFAGALDDVSLYSRALTPAELAPQ